eukprot:Hpha_TRINITY_DN13797_c0_g1::TRINITY_DN13797_c0_g1_i2::g.142520::m.142520
MARCCSFSSWRESGGEEETLDESCEVTHSCLQSHIGLNKMLGYSFKVMKEKPGYPIERLRLERRLFAAKKGNIRRPLRVLITSHAGEYRQRHSSVGRRWREGGKSPSRGGWVR